MEPCNPRPLFDFDLNELPPPDDGLTEFASTANGSPPLPQDDDGSTDDAATAREPSPPPPEDDGTGDASPAASMCASSEKLDLDALMSPLDDDDDDDDDAELEPPPLYEYEGTPEKMTSSYSPAYHDEVAPLTTGPCTLAGPMAPARPSSCMDMHHGEGISRRTSSPHSGMKPHPSTFPVQSSSQTSASRVHAKGTSDTTSSHRSRYKPPSVPRDDDATSIRRDNYDGDAGSFHRGSRRTPPAAAGAYPRHHETISRRSHAPAVRAQDAPRRNWNRSKRYNGHDRGRQGYHVQERPQGYRGPGPRGYAAPDFPAQQGYSSFGQFAGTHGGTKDSCGGRRIPAQEPLNGGYHQYWEPEDSCGGRQVPAQEPRNRGYQYREPPRGHFPAQPYHPYARDAGAIHAMNGETQTRREYRPYQHRRNGAQSRPQAGPARRRQFCEAAYSQSPPRLS